jgi:hypothetical protein
MSQLETLATVTVCADKANRRGRALELLQFFDPDGVYTDYSSKPENRKPCSLWEAIRAAGTIASDSTVIGNCSEERLLKELFTCLSDWAWQANV